MTHKWPTFLMPCLHLLPIFGRPQRFPFGGHISGIQNGCQKTTLIFKCHPFSDFIWDNFVSDGFFMVHSCTEPPTQCRGKTCNKKTGLSGLNLDHNNKAQWSQNIFPKETPKKNTSCNVEAKLNLVPPTAQKKCPLGAPNCKALA